jgi:monofunctional biosynthetic peptidoglycan transglycosylase
MPQAQTHTKLKRRNLLMWVAVFLRRLRWWMVRGLSVTFLLMVAWIVMYIFFNPPGGFYMWQQHREHGELQHEWVDFAQIAPVMARAAVAAEDANFCAHWGFDMAAIRSAIDAGGARGASTISQQTVKNVFLWHGRDWIRKALESVMTLLVESLWPKQRIIEVYLNIAEFDTGVFGVEAAAQHYFGRSASDLTSTQSARLAAILPSPQSRDAANPTDFVRRRAASILDGAATIDADGRADCFQS